MPPLNIAALRKAVSQDQYFITTHAKERMGQRRVSDKDIQRVLAKGDLIEQYPDAQPLPKACSWHISAANRYMSLALSMGNMLTSLQFTGTILMCGSIPGPGGKVAVPRNRKCAECGGTLEEKTITYTHPWGAQIYRFEKVPALVCVQCGHVWLSAKTSQLIDRVVRKRQKPKKYQKVPVFSVPELVSG